MAVLTCSRNKRYPGLASVMLLGGSIVMMLAVIGLAVNLTGFLDAVYMDLALTLPKFDYTVEDGAEQGNETFDAFVQMRYVSAGILGSALAYAGVIRVMEIDEMNLVQRGVSNAIISKSLMFVLFFLVFPAMWDTGAGIMEILAMWILNPAYSFDEEYPCPAEWYSNPDEILSKYNSSPYRTGPEINGSSGAYKPDFVCSPQHKIRYVFNQMLGQTEIEQARMRYHDQTDTFGMLTQDIQNFASSAFVNIFLGLTKALITINVLAMAFIIGIMADVLIGTIIAALPLFLFLTLIPRTAPVANRFIDALPALFLLPILSATVIVVGAGFVAQIGTECGLEYGCSPEEDASLLLYVWISSIGVVFLAVSLPVMLVPILGQVSSMATQVVTGATQAAGIVTGMAVSGGASGISQGISGVRASEGGLRSLAGLGTIAGSGVAGALHGTIGGHARITTGSFGGMDPARMAGPITGGIRSAYEHPGAVAERIAHRNDYKAQINEYFESGMGASENQKQRIRTLWARGLTEVEYDPKLGYRESRRIINNVLNPRPVNPQAARELYKARLEDEKILAKSPQARLLEADSEEKMKSLVFDLKKHPGIANMSDKKILEHTMILRAKTLSKMEK